MCAKKLGRSQGKISFLRLKDHNPKWRCSILIVTKGSGVAHLISQGWGKTKRHALSEAYKEANEFRILTEIAYRNTYNRIIPRNWPKFP